MIGFCRTLFLLVVIVLVVTVVGGSVVVAVVRVITVLDGCKLVRGHKTGCEHDGAKKLSNKNGNNQ